MMSFFHGRQSRPMDEEGKSFVNTVNMVNTVKNRATTWLGVLVECLL